MPGSNEINVPSAPDARHPTLNTLSRWGAIKFTKTAFYVSVSDDRSVLHEKGKDTGKMLEAGAEDVVWVQSPAEQLPEVLPMAVDRLSHLDGIIIEGNSAIEFLKPDIVIFLGGSAEIKPSAHSILKQADILIARKGGSAGSQGLQTSALILPIDHFDEKTTGELVEHMDNILKNKDIAERLTEKAVDSRVPCGVARKIAEELGVPYSEVGKAADALKIKIKNCELGCFK